MGRAYARWDIRATVLPTGIPMIASTHSDARADTRPENRSIHPAMVLNVVGNGFQETFRLGRSGNSSKQVTQFGIAPVWIRVGRLVLGPPLAAGEPGAGRISILPASS